MFTHGNFVAAVTVKVYAFEKDRNEDGLSYLPLAHCFGWIYDLNILCCGGKLRYLPGSVENLLYDCQ
jgi:long-subunit acyl-CoA synthetase (AMP-forming)